MSGKIYIASFQMRGKWAPGPPIPYLKVNVTSCQGKTNPNRLDFSPMTPIEGSYKGYWNFESYWQSGKIYEGVPLEKSKKWWLECQTPKRKYPLGKGKTVLGARYDGYDEEMDYLTARQKIYIPEYYQLIKDRKMTQKWHQEYLAGKNIVIYDLDGPRDSEGEVTCLEFNLELLKEKIIDLRYPLGHGYLVAALVQGLQLEEFN